MVWTTELLHHLVYKSLTGRRRMSMGGRLSTAFAQGLLASNVICVIFVIILVIILIYKCWLDNKTNRPPQGAVFTVEDTSRPSTRLTLGSDSVEHITASPAPSHRQTDCSDSGLYSSSFGTVTDVSPAAGYDTAGYDTQCSTRGAENKAVSL